MRLLRRSASGSLELLEFLGGNVPCYAILSHTWGDDEVVFSDVASGAETKQGYAKIAFCAEQALRDGLLYFWVDTCCINKATSDEVQESISSMFRWYRDAARCYVYLADVSVTAAGVRDKAHWEPDVQRSRWFTRGWTLQELVAPASVEFFSREGVRLGDKRSLEDCIHRATGLPRALIRGGSLDDYSVDERLAWVRNRETKRPEDKAYSLLGFFGIHIPVMYGEGEEHAFKRLRREIDVDLHTVSEHRIPTRGQRPAAEPATDPTWVSPERKVQILKTLHASLYRSRKDRNPERVPGTCEWFVTHRHFATWRKSEASSMLWVSADPGCGKSVLAKHLVDNVLPATKSRSTCYFFFKDDFEDQRHATTALCCILHQLFEQRDVLSNRIAERFETYGERLTGSVSELWDVLVLATQDKNAGEVVVILDAFDECDEQGRSELSQALCRFYSKTSNCSLKLLLTSRPYGDIRRAFQPLDLPGLPVVHLSGENDVETDMISREIDIFIKAKIRMLRKLLHLDLDEEGQLTRELLRTHHRTYLWAHLTLDLIQTDINIDKVRIQQVISHLPKTVDGAYERILAKSSNPEEARKLLHIVVAAARPLTVSEMTVALAIQDSHRSYKDPVLMPEKRFREYVRDLCGLFVTIVDSKFYLLHQTAKEFLVRDNAGSAQRGAKKKPQWKHSLQLRESHYVLSKICLQHQLLVEFYTPRYGHQLTFLDYSSMHWHEHVRVSNSNDKFIVGTVLKMCMPFSRFWRLSFKIYRAQGRVGPRPWSSTPLIIASYFGLEQVVRALLDTNAPRINNRDRVYDRSALSWAAEGGFTNIVKLLIKGSPPRLKDITTLSFPKGADIDTKDYEERTPLSYAARSGHLDVVKALVAAGACVDAKDIIGGTPITYGLCNGQEALIRLLVPQGNLRPGLGQALIRPLLQSALEHGANDTLRLLLESGKVEPDWEIEEGRTALSLAAYFGYDVAVRRLLENTKAGVDTKDTAGQTPLSLASRFNHTAVVKLLLECDEVDVNSTDNHGLMPLTWATMRGSNEAVKLLLESGKADVDFWDRDGMTPFMQAVENDYAEVVKLLLNSGRADVNFRNKDGMTPLALAARNGRHKVMKLLLNSGKADIDSKAYDDKTPLMLAIKFGHTEAAELLLNSGKANVNLKDHTGSTALACAAEYGRAGIMKLLLESGKSDMNARDDSGMTPLMLAAEFGHTEAVELLLASGKANVNLQDNTGSAALAYAADYGRVDIIKLLLESGKADINSRDSSGMIPLVRAVMGGHDEAVRLLLDSDEADVDSKANDGITPRAWAARSNEMDAVERLQSHKRSTLSSGVSLASAPGHTCLAGCGSECTGSQKMGAGCTGNR